MNWITKPFYALTHDELYAILALRQEVFIVEQDCPYLDADGKDQKGHHLMGINDTGGLAAYARLLPPDVSYPGDTSIGRILTSADARGTGTGKALMEEALRQMPKLFGNVPIRISAQTYLLRFYGHFGFQSTGKEYLEDGIPHTEMLLDARND